MTVESPATPPRTRHTGRFSGRGLSPARHASACLCVVSAAALLLSAPSSAASTDSFVSRLLRQERFSAADFRARDAGQAVVKSLETDVRRELAYFGVVYIDVPTRRFVERFVDIERFERGPGIPQIGRFGTVPIIEDLASLTLPAKDVAALARCRSGDCDLKLSAAAMARFRDQVDWSSPNAAQRANEVVRDMILDLVRAYQENGNAALGSYDDGETALPVAGEFRAMINSDHPLPLPVPELMAYLDEYPRNRPAGVSDFFYWSVVDFGLKPTVRVNHVMIYSPDDRPSGLSHVIAIKQLYASHYFHTALEMRFLVEAEGRRDERGFNLLSLTRSRIDGTTGMSGSLLRPIINRRSRTAVAGYLEHLKRQVELTDPRPRDDRGSPCSVASSVQVCVGAQ